LNAFNALNALRNQGGLEHVETDQGGQTASTTREPSLSKGKVYTTADQPELIATIPTGELPHGIWPSGDGILVYVALQPFGGSVSW
jgi:hypothetical protein